MVGFCRETVVALESEKRLVSDQLHVNAIQEVARHCIRASASHAPALGLFMLTCASQLLARQGATLIDVQICTDLILCAEASSPFDAINIMLCHESLQAERPGVLNDALFYAIGLWCHLFSLRPSTMDACTLYAFLTATTELISGDTSLPMCAANIRKL